MPSLSLRIDLDDGGRIGPGKVALLEQVAALGFISAAGGAAELAISGARARTRHKKEVPASCCEALLNSCP